jgi:predicted ArsR family transcriptional regulator
VTADSAIKAIAALDDELRRGMYVYIRSVRRPVTRDEAAAAVGISRKLAAFHLDKLVDAGALRAHYEPAAGIRRVGRSPKVYEPTSADIQVSIPQRRHDVLADILLDAVLTEGQGENARDAALRAARSRGEQAGRDERKQSRPGRLGAERALTLVSGVLEHHGFEPAREAPARIRLRNCPFHPMAVKAPEVVCQMNHAFLAGLLDGLEAPAVEAILDPRSGGCCVELHQRSHER